MKPSFKLSHYQKTSVFLLIINLLCLTTILWAAPTPLPIPFREDFESGQWNVNFATSNSLISIVEVTNNYGPVDRYHLIMHSVINGMTVTNHVDIHLNMTGARRDIYLSFFAKNLYPKIQPVTELWFSDDMGINFTQVGSLLQPSSYTTMQTMQNGWIRYRLNLTNFIRPYGLRFTQHCVIRMVAITQHRPPDGGIAFDNISVQEELEIVTQELPERTLYYDLDEFDFIDIIECGRVDCPPPFSWDERILDEDFWSVHPGENGKAFLEKNGKGYQLRLSTIPNESGYAVSAAALRFDASPWASTGSEGDPAHQLKFSWKSEAKSLTPFDAVYMSENGGDTYARVLDFSEKPYQPGKWQEITMNLDELVNSYGLKFSDRFVVVFQHYTTSKAGSSGYALDDVIVGTTDPVHPKSFTYPNPFRSETNVQFELAQASEVRLKILDSQGEIINIITEKNLPAGTHTLPWNGKDSFGRTVKAGTYFYQLETPQGIETKRILLEK